MVDRCLPYYCAQDNYRKTVVGAPVAASKLADCLALKMQIESDVHGITQTHIISSHV